MATTTQVFRSWVFASLLAVVATAFGAEPNLAGHIDRPLRYWPDGRDFVITNGVEFFNRPLYGGNTAFRVDAGDKPEFLLYLPGRGGNVRLGIRTSAGAKWLNEATQIVARYRPGSMVYEISDPLLSGSTLELTAEAPAKSESLVLRIERHGGSELLELVWACGGASGERGRRDGDIGTENVPISQFFQLEPADCRNNTIHLDGNAFTLRGPRGSIGGLGPPGSSLALADAHGWSSLRDMLASAGKPTDLPVVLGRVACQPDSSCFVVFWRGADSPPPEFTQGNLSQVFNVAEQHRRSIAEKVVADTPDPFVNAAVAALNVAADGVWDEPSGTVQHGAVAWRRRLLGWRGGYANDALGWHNRARRHFAYWAARQNTNSVPTQIFPADPASNLSRNERSLHSNGDLSNSHYDMNLVYIDALSRHLLWTGDLDFARQVWPVIERHLAWERRLFRRPFGPDRLPLYEGYACIWASDDLAYEGGGATHATAYNYFENRMAARLSKLLGHDPTPYTREAELIRRAMRKELWLPDRGWYAEWKDWLGLQLVHPNAALWTFYHTIDSDAASPMEAWQMTRFVDTQLPHIPIRGPNVPDGCYILSTTSWMPYTWSLNNVVMAEVQHTALAYWEANRSEEAFRMFKGSILDSMYLGLCPGNLGMTTYFDAYRGESQRDFADAVGTVSRALIEGLFGVTPDLLAGDLRVRPGFPAEWDRASLKHPDFDLAFRREGLTDTYTIAPHFNRPLALRLQVRAVRDHIQSVTVNGRPASWHVLEDSVGTPRLEIESPATNRYVVAIHWSGEPPSKWIAGPIVASESTFSVGTGAAAIQGMADPQTALSNLTVRAHEFQAQAIGTLGQRTVAARARQGDLRWWLPVTFEIRPPFEVVASPVQDTDHLRFRVRNNTSSTIDRPVEIRLGGRDLPVHLLAPAHGESAEIALPAKGLVPGRNRISLNLIPEKDVEGAVTNWKITAPTNTRWESVNLASLFNDRVTQIFRNDYVSPRSPFCSLAIPRQGIGSWCHFNTTALVDDAGLRSVAAATGGRLILPQGVPLATPSEADAKNIVFTSQWNNYPDQITIPLSGTASHAYLLMAGSCNPMQSRFDDGEVVVTYTDGKTERLALRNPTTWWPIDQDYFLDDFAFRRPEPIPPRVNLLTGKVRMLDPMTFKGEGGPVRGGAANILDVPLRPDQELKSLTVRTLANEVVIGVMAITLAR